MANHGYCHRCWWWEQKRKASDLEHSEGVCWFASCNSYQHFTKGDSYCPDYENRQKGELQNCCTITEFIAKTDKKI